VLEARAVHNEGYEADIRNIHIDAITVEGKRV
jgi:hypothetical protein